MERELTIERTRAGLEVARQLGRKGGRKRQMTESKIKSAKKLLAVVRFLKGPSYAMKILRHWHMYKA